MKTLDWPPNFVARCPVKLFEAIGGSNASWISSGTSGEFYMKPLGNAALYFQLRDLLDNQILFEHTMHKPESFMVSAKRFFVIRLENGSFRGFGFADGNAAFEMKKQIQEAIKPYDIQDYDGERSIIRETQVNNELIQASIPDQKPRANASSTAVTSYGTLRKSSSCRQSSTEFMQEQPSSSPTTFKRKTKQNSPHFKWRLVFRGHLPRFSPRKGLTSLSQMLGWKEEDMEIGYPTDVKHVAHIGWDGPSVGEPSWINELKPAPNFSLGPLQEFGQPQGPEWIHDALSASQWTTPELREKSCHPIPPMPPGEFLDSDLLNSQGQKRKWKIFRLKNKLKHDTNAQC